MVRGLSETGGGGQTIISGRAVSVVVVGVGVVGGEVAMKEATVAVATSSSRVMGRVACASGMCVHQGLRVGSRMRVMRCAEVLLPLLRPRNFLTRGVPAVVAHLLHLRGHVVGMGWYVLVSLLLPTAPLHSSRYLHLCLLGLQQQRRLRQCRLSSRLRLLLRLRLLRETMSLHGALGGCFIVLMMARILE